MQNFRYISKLLRIILDYMSIIVSYWITSLIIPESIIFKNEEFSLILIVVLLVIWFVTSKNVRLYDEFRSRNFGFEIIAVLKNVTILNLSVIILESIFIGKIFPKRFVFLFPAVTFFTISIEKYLIRQLLNYLRLKGRNLRSLIIVGAGELGRKFQTEILNNAHFGYVFLGFVDDNVQGDLNGTYLGKINELNLLFETKQVDEVIVALPNYAMQKIHEVVTLCEQNTTRVRIIPDYFRLLSQKYSVSMFGNFPVIAVGEDKIDDFYWKLVKRVFDFSFSALVFIFLLSWLIPLVSLIIKLTSKGPVFFKQERWGRNNKKFMTYKFRSMVCESKDIDDSGNYLQAIKNDPRITKFGKFIRKTNIDELPQFINVIKGEMSVVGPRPHPTPLNIKSRKNIDRYMRRHFVKPGITGWAQVNGCRGETKDSSNMQKRIEHDIWYIENWSFWLDIQIIILTIWQTLKGDPNAY